MRKLGLWLGMLGLIALVAVPSSRFAQVSQAASMRHTAHQDMSPLWHLSSSLVPTPGAQVAHIDGILNLKMSGNGDLSGTTLHLSTGPTVPVTGSFTRTLTINMTINGMQAQGASTAISNNRITGEYFNASGGAIGFWVATAVKPNQAGTSYAFSSQITSGPDRGTTYDGTLVLWGDKYGGLLGWLTLKDGTVLNADGQDVNGNVNMLIIVRSGTPMAVSGTTVLGGNLRGTIEGPLAGDEGTWTGTH